jgi:hypothetical protein
LLKRLTSSPVNHEADSLDEFSVVEELDDKKLRSHRNQVHGESFALYDRAQFECAC